MLILPNANIGSSLSGQLLGGFWELISLAPVLVDRPCHAVQMLVDFTACAAIVRIRGSTHNCQPASFQLYDLRSSGKPGGTSVVISEGTLACCCGHANAQARAYSFTMARQHINSAARALMELQQKFKVCPRCVQDIFCFANKPPHTSKSSMFP